MIPLICAVLLAILVGVAVYLSVDRKSVDLVGDAIVAAERTPSEHAPSEKSQSMLGVLDSVPSEKSNNFLSVLDR